MKVWHWVLAGVLGVGSGVPFAAPAQQSGKAKAAAPPVSSLQKVDPLVHRLLLKDGSYQVVSQYQMVAAPSGDRVRYISAERGGDWEEIPVTLVDWPATYKYAREHANDAPFARDGAGDGSGKDASQKAGGQQEAAAIDAEEKAERNRDLEVAPNLRLPEETGIWALDIFHDDPELVELEQSSGNVNEKSGHNLLRSALTNAGAVKQTIELDGRHAKAGMHGPQPVFYVSVDVPGDEPNAAALTVDTHGASSVGKPGESGSAATSRYVIVRAQVKKDFRVVPAVKIEATGEASTPGVYGTHAELLEGKRWLKLTPKEPLPADDYVLMEILSAKEVNLSVWDFRVDPGAPDNANAILPLDRGKTTH